MLLGDLHCDIRGEKRVAGADRAAWGDSDRLLSFLLFPPSL